MKKRLHQLDLWLGDRFGPVEDTRLGRALVRFLAWRAERSRWYSPHPLHVRLWRKLPTPLRYPLALVGLALHKLDRGLRVVCERFFGPLETWRISRYLAKRSGFPLT